MNSPATHKTIHFHIKLYNISTSIQTYIVSNTCILVQLICELPTFGYVGVEMRHGDAVARWGLGRQTTSEAIVYYSRYNGPVHSPNKHC